MTSKNEGTDTDIHMYWTNWLNETFFHCSENYNLNLGNMNCMCARTEAERMGDSDVIGTGMNFKVVQK